MNVTDMQCCSPGFSPRCTKGVPNTSFVEGGRIFKAKLGTGTQEPPPLKPVALAEQLSHMLMMISVLDCTRTCSKKVGSQSKVCVR